VFLRRVLREISMLAVSGPENPGIWEVGRRTLGLLGGLEGMVEADAEFFAFAGVGSKVVGQQVAATGQQVV
jgi:hypothetical protein